MASTSSSPFDEHRWVVQIRRTLEDELEEEETDVPVCIFSVPKHLWATDPDSYVPQQVSLGPYHHRRPELYDMERYKLAAAKRTQKTLETIKFEQLVEQFTKLETKIRACYHKYLDYNGETLAWMMAVDASFLLEFLQIYAVKEGRVLTRVSSGMSHLVDVSGRKSAHNAILRDMVMMENQIPLFLLRKLLEIQFSSLELANSMLLSMLMGLYKELSPFKMVEELPEVEASEISHLLDFLYQVMVPKSEEEEEVAISEAEEQCEGIQSNETSQENVKPCLENVQKIISRAIQTLRRALCSERIKNVLKLPWTVVSSHPGLRILKQPVEYLFFSDNKESRNGNENPSDISRPPLVEEITIPSVSELFKAGVQFVPTKGSILTINFDVTTGKMYLPTVSLEVNTEIILRNIVAYEACNASGPLVFTRYTELMNGIIDTEEDVRLLRERGIVLNRLKSDEEVARLWNGMSKAVRLTNVPFLDKVIEDVNAYYDGRWKVKLGKFMKLYVFGSWKLLTLLATIWLLSLMSLQAYCLLYSYARVFQVIHIH